jgi:succinate dehydrogenase / fumarate reductase, membrane anchor subunit
MTMKWNKQDIQSPLGRARGLGSAKEGTDHWWAQRVTAIANIPLVIWLVYNVVNMRGASHAEFTAWLGQPVNAILMILTLISIFYHAKLGAQVITEDYIHCETMKTVKLIGQKLAFFGLAVACIFSVLKIAL